MGLVETEAIILRSYRLAEADKIVIGLTKGAGVVRGVAHGARRLKSKYGASLEPFTHVALQFYEKEGRELVSLRQVEILKSYFALAQNTEAVHALEYWSELVLEFAPPHEPNEKLFRMVKACVEALGEEPARIEACARYFEVWMLKLAGFLPDLRACAVCGRSFTEGESAYVNLEQRLRCAICSKRAGEEWNGQALTRMRMIRRLSPLEFARANLDEESAVSQEMARITQRLIARALERTHRGQASFILAASEK